MPFSSSSWDVGRDESQHIEQRSREQKQEREPAQEFESEQQQ
jgi:hypothetical protein